MGHTTSRHRNRGLSQPGLRRRGRVPLWSADVRDLRRLLGSDVRSEHEPDRRRAEQPAQVRGIDQPRRPAVGGHDWGPFVAGVAGPAGHARGLPGGNGSLRPTTRLYEEGGGVPEASDREFTAQAGSSADPATRSMLPLQTLSEVVPRVGIVLAAGRSERLRAVTGGGSKGLVQLGGLKLVERAIRTLLNAGVEHVLVVVGYHAGPVGAVVSRLQPGRVR